MTTIRDATQSVGSLWLLSSRGLACGLLTLAALLVGIDQAHANMPPPEVFEAPQKPEQGAQQDANAAPHSTNSANSAPDAGANANAQASAAPPDATPTPRDGNASAPSPRDGETNAEPRAEPPKVESPPRGNGCDLAPEHPMSETRTRGLTLLLVSLVLVVAAGLRLRGRGRA